jgi:hypothetical protein
LDRLSCSVRSFLSPISSSSLPLAANTLVLLLLLRLLLRLLLLYCHFPDLSCDWGGTFFCLRIFSAFVAKQRTLRHKSTSTHARTLLLHSRCNRSHTPPRPTDIHLNISTCVRKAGQGQDERE